MFKRDLEYTRELVLVQKAPELMTTAPHMCSTQTINALWKWFDAGSVTINCQLDKVGPISTHGESAVPAFTAALFIFLFDDVADMCVHV